MCRKDEPPDRNCGPIDECFAGSRSVEDDCQSWTRMCEPWLSGKEVLKIYELCARML